MTRPVCLVSLASLCFFFFQAEDGIRDYKVTGVQTCALPISSPETIEILAADCETPKTEFFLGDTVCAKTDNVTEVDRWVNWLSPPDSHVAHRSEEHTSELQSPCNLVCRLLLEKKNEPVEGALPSHVRDLNSGRTTLDCRPNDSAAQPVFATSGEA